MCCTTICKQFTYCSLRTKICWFFAEMERELGALCVVRLPQVRGKLIYQAPSANCSQTVWFTCGLHVYTGAFRINQSECSPLLTHMRDYSSAFTTFKSQYPFVSIWLLTCNTRVMYVLVTDFWPTCDTLVCNLWPTCGLTMTKVWSTCDRPVTYL